MTASKHPPGQVRGQVTMLRHGKIDLALHHLRDATAAGGRPLLILHGLGEASPATVPTWADMWPGPVAALDFTGHGLSTIPHGGGYTAELLLGDQPQVLGGHDARQVEVFGIRVELVQLQQHAFAD